MNKGDGQENMRIFYIKFKVLGKMPIVLVVLGSKILPEIFSISKRKVIRHI